MKLHARIVAGTALGVLMASAPVFADERQAGTVAPENILLAQNDAPPAEEVPLKEGDQPAPAGDQPAPAPQPTAQEPAPAPNAAEPAPEPQPEQAAEPQPAPEPQAAPQANPEPEAAPQAAPEPAPKEAPQAEIPPEPAPKGDAAPQDAPAMEAPEPRPQPQDPAPEAEQPAQTDKPAAGAPAVEPPPADAAPRDGATPAPNGGADQPAADAPAPQQQPAPAGDAPVQPVPKGTPPAPEAAPAPSDQPSPPPGDQSDVMPENAAPILDSAKQPGVADGDQPVPEVDVPETEDVPPPTSDQDAQTPEISPRDIESITATEGRRIDREEYRRERDERPEGADVLREIGERIIYQLGGETFVRGPDRGRLERNAEDIYYEELPRGRVRETIVRPNGVQIVTVRNRFGDVIRRSRVMPDGREVILTYVDERDYDRQREWRDPGRDLPPLRLRIPYREYILDAGQVEDPDRYYQFLDQPPVERARQLYSVDDVKRSARLRDTVRRVDLDTITFPTGSAQVDPSEVDELEGIASAIQRMLDENPAETFLIEGHTDAVGSDVSNLALSDARAEGVATVLTQYYDIPPENLVTQGYGERYLKIATDGPSRENRRVAIRRITPLVTPVASAQ